MSLSPSRTRERVPVRTIAASIGMVLATVVVLFLIVEVRRTLVWLVVAAFFSVALYPVVNWVQRRLTRCRRSVATLVVFLVVFLVLGGLIAAFAVPLARQGTTFADQLPQLLNDAKAGRGPVGSLLDRTNALQYVQQNQARIRSMASGLTTPAAGVLRGVATGIAGAVTIFVLSYLMVLEAPKMIEGTLNLLSPSTPTAPDGWAPTAPSPSPGTSRATC